MKEEPQLRIELAIYCYQNEDISLAKAAYLACISFDRMKELLVDRGISVRLGPRDRDDAKQEIESMERILEEKSPR